MFYKLLKFPLHKQQYLLLSGLKIWIYPSSNRTVPTVYLQLQGLQNTVCTIVHIIIHMVQYCTFVKAHYICTFLGLKRQPLDRVHFFGMLGVFHCTFTVQYSVALVRGSCTKPVPCLSILLWQTVPIPWQIYSREQQFAQQNHAINIVVYI